MIDHLRSFLFPILSHPVVIGSVLGALVTGFCIIVAARLSIRKQ
jgi:hypothetical protein